MHLDNCPSTSMQNIGSFRLLQSVRHLSLDPLVDPGAPPGPTSIETCSSRSIAIVEFFKKVTDRNLQAASLRFGEIVEPAAAAIEQGLVDLGVSDLQVFFLGAHHYTALAIVGLRAFVEAENPVIEGLANEAADTT